MDPLPEITAPPEPTSTYGELSGRDAIEDQLHRDEPVVPLISGHPSAIHVNPAGGHDVERDLPGLLLGG